MPYHHKPELIELLINEPISEQQVNNPDNYVEVISRVRPQGFAEHFALLLEDIPAIHSSIAPEFFLYFFLGTSLTLPNTSLMSKLNIEDVFFKFDKNALKLIFKIRNQDYYKLKFIIINTDTESQNVKFTEKELSEAKRQLSDSTSNIIPTEIEGQILHIVNDKGFKVKILPELSHQSFTTLPPLSSDIQPIFHKVRKDIVQEINIGDEKRILQDFDPLLDQLSKNVLSDVQTNTQNIFALLKTIYKSYPAEILSTSEASYHGYSYGFFRLNYKYKYGLDCYVERIAGKGYMDLVLLSRKDNKNPLPIIVEFKANHEGANKAIEQINKNGYIYNLPNIRTNAKEAIIVGIDFNTNDQQAGSSKQIDNELIVQGLNIRATPTNLISQLAEDVFNKKKTPQKIVKNIQESIEHLYYSSMKSKDNYYLSRVLLGQTFTSKNNNNNEIHVFLYNKDGKLNLISDRVTSIVLQQDSKGIILNIIEGSNTHQTRSKIKKEDKIFDGSKIPPVEKLAIQDLTIINIAVNPKAKIFSGVIDKSYITSKAIKIENKNINEFSDNQKYLGQFKRIATVEVQDLIDLIDNPDSSVDSDNEYLPPKKKQKFLAKDFQTTLLQCLSPIKELIGKESDLQAIIQGMFINQRLDNDKQIKVFSEVIFGSGRADLALFIVDNSFKEYKLVLIELKYGSNSKLLTDAKKQLLGYSKYLKSATKHKEVLSVAIVYNPSNKQDNFLQVKISSNKIDHTSSSSHTAQGSGAEKSVNKKVKKLLKISDLESWYSIKTIDNDIFFDLSHGSNNQGLSDKNFVDVTEFLGKVKVSLLSKIALSLAGNHINKDQASKLFRLLEKNAFINSLDISNTGLDKQLLNELIEALIKKENLINYESLSPADKLWIIQDLYKDLSNADANARVSQLLEDPQLLADIQAVGHLPISSEEQNKHLENLFIRPERKIMFSSLKKLDLSNNKLGIEVAPILEDALSKLNGMEEINLSNNKLRNEGLKSIARGLESNYSTKILKLSNIGITKITEELSEILSKKAAIIELDLSDNNLSNAEIAVLIDALTKANAIKKLNLSGNNIQGEALNSLTHFIENSNSLQELILSNTNLGNRGVELIARALSKSDLNLFLDISHNRISEADILFKHLNSNDHNQVLTGLVLANNEISEVIELSDALIDNKKLRYLDLSNNKITFEGASFIFFSLRPLDDGTPQNDILDTLILSNNPISIDLQDQDSVSDLYKMLKHNDGLTHLALSNIAIDDSLLTKILDSLQENTCLESIDLSYNQIQLTDHKTQGQIREFLRENTILTELNLANNEVTDQGGKIIISSFLDKKIMNKRIVKRIEFIDLDLSGNPSLGKEFIKKLIDIIKSEYPIENLRLANNNWPIKYTTGLIDAIVNSEKRKVNIDLSGNKVTPNSQVRLNNYRTAIKLQTLDDNYVVGTSDLQNPCLPSTSKGKRSISDCKIGWSDVDEISSSKTRNIDKIVIDAEKFLKHSKQHMDDREKSAQLVSLVKEIKHQGDHKIVGNNKYLLARVIMEGGYKNYVQNERINDLGHDVISRDSYKISPTLKLKLINAAGKMQLTYGIYGSLMTCKDGEAESCALSVGGLGYSFLSQPIENVMVKITPKVVNSVAHGVGKVIPRILNYDTKFIVQLAKAKYGTKVAKGIAGALGGAFDIIDITMSSNMLVECNKRASSNNTCSDKEIRDNIASISLSGISFVSGIGLAILGSAPLAIGIGLGFVVVHGIYNGISNIIEYEEKYDTTHGENWSIFLRTVLLKRMSEDVEHLKARHDAVNDTVKNAWNMLEESPEEVVAYAVGLGKIELSYTPLCKTVTLYHPVFCIGRRPQEGPCKDGGNGVIAQNVTECTIRSQYIPHLYPASSRIDMQKQDIKYTKNLSRVLPDPVVNATMICLPQITNAIYEKGITSSRSGAIYECDNAVVMVHNQRQHSQVKDKYIIYDLKNVNSGTIIGSNTLNNIFQIFEGDPVILGSTALDNRFVILADKYHGKIYLGGNSTNIIDVSHLRNQHISMEYTHIYPLTMNMSITIDNKIISQVDSRAQDVEIRYIGRKYKGDKIVCKYLSHQEDGNIIQDNIVGHNNIIIDSGGGGDYSDQDQIQNCNKVIVSPNTIVQGSNGNYTFYIISQNYSAIYAISDIDIVGRGTIIFPEISLLKDCNQINYSAADNTLSFNIPLNENGTYLLRLKNYLNKDNDTNYVLVDKYGSNIVYQYTINNNNQIMGHFALYAECRFDTTQKVVNHYRNISYSDKNYAVFGTVKNNQYNNFLKFGSSGSDVIISDKDVVFMEGSKGNDIYIVNNDAFYKLNINNKAQDLQLDILSILCVNNMLLVKNTDDLHLLFNSTEDNAHQSALKEIIINNYFLDHTYQHIALMDKDGNSFIPFFMLGQDVVLVPFYHASLVKNIYILSANSYEQAVIDIDMSNIMFYRQDNNLLLVEKEAHGLNSLSIILKDYYLQKQQWSGIKLYSYNNGDYNCVDLNNIELSTISYQGEYDSVIQEYTVNFAEKSQEIAHNQRNINDQLVSIEPNQEKIGRVILQNITPESLEVTFHKDDLILTDNRYNNQLVIKNWYKDNKYIISVLEFDAGIEPIRIHVLDKDYGHILNKLIDRIKLNNKLDSEIANINTEIVQAVEHFLIVSCAKHNEKGNLPEKLRYNFLENEIEKIGSSKKGLTQEEVIKYLNSADYMSGKAFMLLVAKSYNELLFKYPNIEKESLYKIDDSCFGTILTHTKIDDTVRHLNASIEFSYITQFVNSNKYDIQRIITELAKSNMWDANAHDVVDSVHEHYHKHRHHHGEAHDRGRRDVDKADFSRENDNQNLYSASGAASSKPMPTVYNAVKWVGGGIGTILHYLNPVEQIQHWFNKDESRIDEEIIDMTNNSEQSNNQIFEENQDILESKLLGIKSIEEQILELEDNKIEAKSILRKLQQKVKIAEEQYRDEEEQYREYEEELSNRLEKLVKKRLWIQKQASEEYMELIRSEINNAIEKKETAITELYELNDSYRYELKSVRTKLLKNKNMADLIVLRALEDKIQNCEAEDRKLNNDLEKLQAYNELDTDEIRQYIRYKLDKLNIDESNVLSEEEYLIIKDNKLNNQRQEVCNIRDQIKEKECIIEEYGSKLNELNQQLEVLQAEVKDLSLNNKLLHWKQQVIAQDYNDVSLQEPDKWTTQFSPLEEENTVSKIERFVKHHEKELKQKIVSELKVNESATLFTMESLIKSIDMEEQQRIRRATNEENEIENISDNVISNAASSMSLTINNMFNLLGSNLSLLQFLNPVHQINWFTAENIKTSSIKDEQTSDNSTTKNSSSINSVDYAQFNLNDSLTLADFIIRKYITGRKYTSIQHHKMNAVLEERCASFLEPIISNCKQSNVPSILEQIFKRADKKINYIVNKLEQSNEKIDKLVREYCDYKNEQLKSSNIAYNNVIKEECNKYIDAFKFLFNQTGLLILQEDIFTQSHIQKLMQSNDFPLNGDMFEETIQENFSSKIILTQRQEWEDILNDIINLQEQLLLHESYKNKIKLIKNPNIDEDEQGQFVLSENVHFVEIEQEKLVWQKMSEEINLLRDKVIENPTNKDQVTVISCSDIPNFDYITIARVDLIKLLTNKLVLLQEKLTNYLIMIKDKTDIVQMTTKECNSEDRDTNLINYDIYNRFTDVEYKSNFEMLRSSHQLVDNTTLVNEHYTTNIGNCTSVTIDNYHDIGVIG